MKKFTRSQDGISRTTIKVEHRLSIPDVALCLVSRETAPTSEDAILKNVMLMGPVKILNTAKQALEVEGTIEAVYNNVLENFPEYESFRQKLEHILNLKFE